MSPEKILPVKTGLEISKFENPVKIRGIFMKTRNPKIVFMCMCIWRWLEILYSEESVSQSRQFSVFYAFVFFIRLGGGVSL